MNTPFPFIGYHGCDRKTAQKILINHEALHESDAESEWLGTGVYFWNNDPQRALEWAKHKEVETPYVIGAIIQPQKLLDFSTREAESLVKCAYDWLYDEYQNSNEKLPKNQKFGQGDLFYKNRKLDCLVMNTLHANSLQEHDVFSAPFLEGDPIYETGFFLRETHVQICVKNLNAIVGYFHPSEKHSLNLPPLVD
ncbi:MAG: hypothetical protein E7037_02365 [Verrucomicrobia bacterium]|nr:hypothetical protein [Verrucomicrobiota bacterium]